MSKLNIFNTGGKGAFSKGVVSSVGYTFAMAALCSLAIAPQAALADDETADESASGEAAQAQTGKRVYSAPVAQEKNETVYLFANPDGSVKNTEVSTTLKNPLGESELADESTLTDIENAESDGSYTGAADDMVWAADGQDVYYTGNSSAQAPVSVKITYKLDGKRVTYDQLAGATGRLKIRFDYTNTATVTSVINGKEETLYVPFTFATGMLFDNDEMKNAKVTNGKVVDDGDRTIIVGYAVPGLQRSLGSLVDDFDIPDYFEVEGDVENFEMGTTLTIATAGLMEDFDTDDIDTSELEDASGDLTEAIDAILDGTNELKDGLEKLADGAKSAKVASGQLAEGADTLAKGAGALVAGIGDKNDTAKNKTLIGGMNSLKSGYDSQLLNPVKKTVSEIETFVSENETNIAVAWEALQGMDKAIDALDKAIKALGEVDKDDLSALSGQLSDLQTKLDSAQDAIAKAQGMIGMMQQLDMSGVKNGLESAGGNIQAAANDLVEAGTSTSSAGDSIKEAGTSLGAAAKNASELGAAVETIVAELTTGQKGALAGALGTVKSSSSDLTANLGGVQKGLEAAGANLEAIGGGLSDAGTELKSAGSTLESVGSSLTKLQSSLPSAGEIAEIKSLLDSAQGSLTDENIEIMDQCIDSLETALGKLDIKELNGEIKLLKQYYPEITEYIESTNAKKAMKELQTKLDAAVDGMEQVSDGMATEQEGLATLREGADKLADGSETLADSLHKYDDGLTALQDGTNSAVEGTGKLADGVQEFKDEGISKISDLIDDDLLPFVDRLDAITAAAKDYNNFAGITEGTTGSVKFIIETDAISLDEE